MAPPAINTKTSRSNAKRPREEKSTKPPPKLRQIKGLEGAAKQRNVRFDPRFSSSCGQFDEFRFHQDYSFINELRKTDIQELKKAFRRAKREGNSALSDRIRCNLLRLENQQKAEMERQKMENIRLELRRENIERMNRGERPIYLNNAELMARANCENNVVAPNS
ncbi:hypothetical protein niasHS_013574 [Heterodera schachtii]|uniref:rRNA biogenesis protein RRP36 n=1 Tax=Heterodera schachtii TaxID=97005 RepID=A0ABD2IAQ5_HETSC